MKKNPSEHPFKSVLSLEPLLNFWRKNVVPTCSHMAAMFEVFESHLNEIPYLKGDIQDISVLKKHQDLLIPLMSVVFPAASWNHEVAGALVPYTSEAFYISPKFQELLIDEKGGLKGRSDGSHTPGTDFTLKAYYLILDRIYGIRQRLDAAVIHIVPDPDTGLNRYFRATPDLQFTDVRSLGEPPRLTQKERSAIVENITDLDTLAGLIRPEKFEFSGFTVVRAVDVTESEVLSALEKDLIDQQSIFSADGFRRLQERLRTLFRRPELIAGMGAVKGDHVLVLTDGCETEANCIFSNSSHIRLSEIEGSVWLRAVDQGTVLRVPDLKAETDLTPIEKLVLESGARSMLISPLSYQGENIGTFEIMTPHPNDLGPIDTILVEQISPLFSVALKRGLDEMNNAIQSIIKEKCTAVHPSVEWRFQNAAFSHMDRLRVNHPSEMESIIFKDVIPLFAQSDIRGSSEARNAAIQTDLLEQLGLALEIMKRSEKAKPWPLLSEFRYRIEHRMEGIRNGLSSDDENSISWFLQDEVEATFEDLSDLGAEIREAIEEYRQTVDPVLGVVYRKRREFEESVSMLNKAMSEFLDEKDSEAQAIFPHYFEKRQTDGIDYVMYVGSSMMENSTLPAFHVKNLGLWQFLVACGLAGRTEQMKSRLKVPLDTCHLILVNNSPLSIRFRFDEKRFDVDGAYDVRHEIIKSRIDKAVVKGSKERLTQPGKIAVVYSHTAEGREAQRHISFLQAKGHLLYDLERLDLDELPGVRGLKALRVSVNLKLQRRK